MYGHMKHIVFASLKCELIRNLIMLLLTWSCKKDSYSLACGKVMPVKEGESVSVYISHPVP